MKTYSLPNPSNNEYKYLNGKYEEKLFNSVVVLTDFRKRKFTDVDASIPGTSSLFLTPPRSTPSPSYTCNDNIKKDPESKKKTRSWDPETEYEVERIVGYHRDPDGRMYYLIKWKGWSKKYNTFETLENLTSCHFLLMKFFEVQKPSVTEFAKKKKEVEKSLKKNYIYQKLNKNMCSFNDLAEFSENCFDISRLFKESNLDNFERFMVNEFSWIIRCLIGMGPHEDPKLFERAQNYRICLKMIKIRKKQLMNLEEAQKKISSCEKVLLEIENNLDFEEFPESFIYTETPIKRDVSILADPLTGCDCSNFCGPDTPCCGRMAGFMFAYTSKGKLRYSHKYPIYECNWRCSCPTDCANRVVQKGRQIPLSIFKTKDCGWGVKTLQKISKGEFVCEYVGEIIDDVAADVRSGNYGKSCAYLFNLDYNPDDMSKMLCVDATQYGNVGRFINHSCSPNLMVYPVWIDCLDNRYHRLAFFALRHIRKGEELNFDYENIEESDKTKDNVTEKNESIKSSALCKVPCLCKASNCRKWIFTKA